MLFLLFQLGDDRYAIAANQVSEVLPLVQLKVVPLAPPGVAGMFNYRGTPVPVVDLCALTIGRPARAALSTRLVLAHYVDRHDRPQRLGLIAERATDTIRREASDFRPSTVSPAGAPFLGRVATDARGLIQWIDVAALLSDAVRDVLFAECA